MAKASKHHMSHDGQGKGTGAGAMTDMPADTVEDNMILSNRDKAQHSDTRGLDSKTVQSEQAQSGDTDTDKDADDDAQGR